MRPIEPLEIRRLLASFTASSVAELIADINAANAAGGSNTITLAPGSTFELNAADNTTGFDANGLPVIAAGNDLTIVGNGDRIQRSAATGTPAFRFFEVAIGGALALSNLTLANGLATPAPTFGTSGEGGAIYNQGTLSLSGVTVENCIARAQSALSHPALGGGIYSSGMLTISDSALLNNQALGNDGQLSSFAFPYPGGAACGGGLFVAGTATLTNTIVSSNLARGGKGLDGGSVGNTRKGGYSWPGGAGGDAFGGGIYASSNATLTLRGTTVSQNTAAGGIGGSTPKNQKLPPGPNGTGQGGGIYIASGALAGLDAFTLANTRGNTASTSDNDIFGSFSILA